MASACLGSGVGPLGRIMRKSAWQEFVRGASGKDTAASFLKSQRTFFLIGIRNPLLLP